MQWQPTPVHLSGKSHGWRSLVGCSPWGLWELETTEWLHFQFSLSWIGEGNGNPLQYSCLENSRDRGAWWAAIYGVTQSWTRLKQLSRSSSMPEPVMLKKLKLKLWSFYESFYEDLQDLIELTPPKEVPFIIGHWRAKVGSQETPGVTGKFGLGVRNEGRAKANRVLSRELTGNSKHPLPTTQEMTLHMDITRWSILKSDWLYSLQPKMEKLYMVSKKKTRSWLWLRSWTLYCQIQT